MRVVNRFRVSTDEQGKSEYFVREQLHTLDVYSSASDALAQRREFNRRLGLKAVANQDRSITLTWFMDVELEVIRCQEEGTSTR